MKKIETQILMELWKDAQIPFSTIAKKLNVSPETIAKKYKEMKDDGIIFRSSITIDLSRIGYQGKIFLLITARPKQDRATILEALKKIRNIIVVTEIIGDFDILAIGPINDKNSIDMLIEEVKRVPGVKGVEITLLNDTIFPIGPRFEKLISR
jgi:DNA-binding Lrp family transcriptional regulator